MHTLFGDHLQGVITSYESLLGMSPVSLSALPVTTPRTGGVYLFSEGDRHLYVGRSRRLRNRLREHARPSATDAPFAFRLARQMVGRPTPSYRKAGGRKELLRDPEFMQALAQAKDRIRRMDVRFVAEPDDVRQTLLELYAAVATDAIYNEFRTT